ncbi:MAG: N-acetylmuramoyl-L-alanine amidase [Blautia sp.]|nr:N-acetylmuramoyl-L-alanine amidase [Blautia sp.]
MKKKFEIFMVACLFVSSFLLARAGAALVANRSSDKPCIVLDAGHGGADPGKVGGDDILEKDLNLQIVFKLKTLFENKGFEVVLTRTDDKALVSDNSKALKVEDMRNRVALIEKASPIMTISIHQNSYTDPAISGPQVFFYDQSPEGEQIAATIQAALNEQLDPPKQRVSKSNDDYYILKKTPSPTVIVECGFLSNPEEAAKLTDEAYQNKLARAIYSGVCTYLSENGGTGLVPSTESGGTGLVPSTENTAPDTETLSTESSGTEA